MKIIDLPISAITPSPWNSNEMDVAMRSRLLRSIEHFGMVVPLVVRRAGKGRYETVGGAQRLAVLQGMGLTTAPCVVVKADDAEARLLSQALNRIAGSDNLGLRAELMREVLKALPEEEVLAILPETGDSLRALSSLGKEDIAEQLRAFERGQAARLCHFAVQLTPSQQSVVERALGHFLPQDSPNEGGNPNKRGVALYHLCQAYLKLQGGQA